MSDRAVDFLVGRNDLSACRIAEAPPAAAVPLADGDVLLRVERFAMTANNVTYGRVGEALGYWSFFPAPDGWGRIPVWGFGEVVRSTRADLAPGERLFGYFPMSSLHVMHPSSVTEDTVVEGAAHRQALPKFYNRYARAGADPLYTRDTEALQMIFRPLFLTAFLLDHELASATAEGVRSVVLTSASSKTALALASLLSRNRRAPGGVVGLTSATNRGFVESLGFYDRAVVYDEIERGAIASPVAIVDMAGNGDVLARLHRHLEVHASILVGITHGGGLEPPRGLPGATPTFFFAPDVAVKRANEWGAAEMTRRTTEAWRAFVADVEGKMRIVESRGAEAVEAAYRATLEGRVDPADGLVLSLAV